MLLLTEQRDFYDRLKTTGCDILHEEFVNYSDDYQYIYLIARKHMHLYEILLDSDGDIHANALTSRALGSNETAIKRML